MFTTHKIKPTSNNTLTKIDSPEQSEYWALGRKIDFEYAHGVGFFQGQEPEDSSYKYDEEFYREKGYEPPKNKRNMKRD